MEHVCNKEDVVNRNTKDIGTIFELIEKIRNRLPHWATLLISFMTLAIGWLLAIVVMKFGAK